MHWGQSMIQTLPSKRQKVMGSIPDRPCCLENQTHTLRNFGDFNGHEPGIKKAFGKPPLNPQPSGIWDQLP